MNLYLKRLVVLYAILNLILVVYSEVCDVTNLSDKGEEDFEVQYQVAVQHVEIKTSTGSCSGSLIKKDWILTTRSCKAMQGDSVLLGRVYTKNAESLVVAQAYPHRSGALKLLHTTTPSLKGVPIEISNRSSLNPSTILRTGTFNSNGKIDIGGTKSIPMDECEERIPEQKIRSLKPREEFCTVRPITCPGRMICPGAAALIKEADDTLKITGIANPPDMDDETLCVKMPEVSVFTRTEPFKEWIDSVTANMKDNSTRDASEEPRGQFPTSAIIVLGSIVGFFLLAALLRIVLMALAESSRGEEEIETDYENVDHEQPIDLKARETTGNSKVVSIKSPPPSP